MVIGIANAMFLVLYVDDLLIFSKNVKNIMKKKLFGKFDVTTLALGSQPRQGLTRVWAKREARESHLMLPRVQKNVRE
jgi:hypothetical protein